MNSIAAGINNDDTRFPSFDSLRVAHLHLRKHHQEYGKTPDFLDNVEKFIGRVRETGALLYDEDDRVASQNIMDYWTILLYRANRKLPDQTLVDYDLKLAPKTCPYIGLDAFQENDFPVFFGRRNLIEDSISYLNDKRLLSIVGPSGAGKSSLVMAGLLPALKAGTWLPGSQNWHYYPRMVPGPFPFRNLALILRSSQADTTWDQNQLQQKLQEDPNYLSHLADELQKPAVIFLDQFEELFTLCNSPNVTFYFIKSLMNLIHSNNFRHTVILTLRIEFLDEIARLSELQKIPELQRTVQSAQLYVRPLSADELRETIEKPAESVKLKFEPGVIDALVRDIMSEPAGLPLLQFTLLKLWEKREDNLITLDAYRSLGGARGALTLSADEFYKETLVNEDEREAAKYILLRLAKFREDLQVTSNRIQRNELYKDSLASDLINKVLDKLSKAGLIRWIKGETPDDDQIEIAHEALILHWGKLMDWLVNERANVRQWEEDLAFARSRQLAESSTRRLDEKHHQLSLLLALEALNTTERFNERLVQVYGSSSNVPYNVSDTTKHMDKLRVPAENALRQALARSGGYALGSHEGIVSTMVISPDGDWLITGGQDKTVRLWPLKNLKSSSAKPIFLNVSKDWINALVISKSVKNSSTDDKYKCWLAVGCKEGLVRLYDLNDTINNRDTTNRDPILLKGPGGSIRALAISPDNRWLIVGAESEVIHRWDLNKIDPEKPDNYKDKKPDYSLYNHARGIRVLAISAHSHLLFTGSDDHTVRYLNLKEEGNILLKELYRFKDAVWSMAISSKWLVAGSIDHTACVWNCERWGSDSSDNFDTTPNRKLDIHQGAVNVVVISPDGNWLVTGSEDHIVRVWDLKDQGSSSHILKGHEQWIDAAAFSKNEYDLRLMSVAATDELVNEGRSLVIVGLVGTDLHIRIFDASGKKVADKAENELASGETLTALKQRLNPFPEESSLSQEDKQKFVINATSIAGHTGKNDRLVTAGGGKIVCVWDLNSLNPAANVVTWYGYDGPIRTLAITSDNKVATAGDDGIVRLRDLTDFDTEPVILRNPPQKYDSQVVSGDIWATAISPNDKWLFTGSGNSTVYRWNVQELSNEPKVLRPDQWGICTLTINSDSSWLAYGTDNGTVHLRNLKDLDNSLDVLKEKTEPKIPIRAIAISPDNKWLIAGDRDSNIFPWWNFTSKSRELIPLNPQAYGIRTLAISRDSRWLVSHTDNGTVRLWNLEELRLWKERALPYLLEGHKEGPIRSIAIGSRWLVTGGVDCTACLWDLTANDFLRKDQLGSGEPEQSQALVRKTPFKYLRHHNSAVITLAISLDDKWLATGSEDKSVCLWNLEANDPSKVPFNILQGHKGAITALVISSDKSGKRWLITGSDDGTARLWDLNDLDAEPVILRDHTGIITSVALSSDSKYLVTTSTDGTVRVWSLQLDELIKRAKAMVGRNFTWEEWRAYFPRQDYRKTLSNLPFPGSVVREIFRQAQLYADRGETENAKLTYKKAADWAADVCDSELNREICTRGNSDGFEEYVKSACKSSKFENAPYVPAWYNPL